MPEPSFPPRTPSRRPRGGSGLWLLRHRREAPGLRRASRRRHPLIEGTPETTGPAPNANGPRRLATRKKLFARHRTAATKTSGHQINLRAVAWKCAPLLIVLIALSVRTVALDRVPVGFFCDEAAEGLDALSLSQNLRDIHDRALPFYMEGPGEWRGGLHTYCLMPFVSTFGLSEWSVRLGSAFIGALTVALLFFYLRRAEGVFPALIGALLLALSPWHIMHSRIGWDVISVPFATLLLLLALQAARRNTRYLPLAFAIGGLGLTAYFPARLFIPLLGFAWLIIYRRTLWRPNLRRALPSGALALFITLIPTYIAWHNGTLFARLGQFHDLPQNMGDRLHDFALHYITHFSPLFLFAFPHDWNLRHAVPGFGPLPLWQAPFLIVGIVVMVRRALRGRRSDQLYLAWLAAYPVAASLVGEPTTTRSITGLLVLEIAIVLGICAVGRWAYARLASRRIRKMRGSQITRAAQWWTLGVAALLALLWTSRFMHVYLNEYPEESTGYYAWQWGAKPAITALLAHRADYDGLFLNSDYNSPGELLQFYMPPKLFSKSLIVATDLSVARPEAYQPFQHQLWATTAESWDTAKFQNVPHRIIERIPGPGGAQIILLETGPQVTAANR